MAKRQAAKTEPLAFRAFMRHTLSPVPTVRDCANGAVPRIAAAMTEAMQPYMPGASVRQVEHLDPIVEARGQKADEIWRRLSPTDRFALAMIATKNQGWFARD